MDRTTKQSKKPAVPARTKDVEPPAGGTRTKTLASRDNPVLHRKSCKMLYLDWMCGHVLTKQTAFMIKLDDSSKDTALEFIAALRESVQPRDAVEEMLLMQMAWTHARMAKLMWTAVDQEMTVNVRALNEACDRAANTFRRLMLALSEYRRPPRADAFVAIKQANLAGQQLVQNGAAKEFQIGEVSSVSNEQGSSRPAQLPAVAEGLGIAQILGKPKQAVAAEHRPKNGKR